MDENLIALIALEIASCEIFECRGRREWREEGRSRKTKTREIGRRLGIEKVVSKR